ncbi:uncharacterized protein LOC131649397 [Vicia villosa]|uniref:uncharacterized protein LOC131649397 n=1 Tax=Vicia villosa TaxID=3911 RepID=UPI00273B0F9D|nr:uncharacterized protein LOC131649397 [Vicia villosa]
MHARKSTRGSVPETFSVQGREGSSYVHNAIANIVTRILSEGHKVEGISVPLAQMPASDDDQGEQDDASKDSDKNVETSADKNYETPVVAKDVETTVNNDETPVAKDVETSEAINVEASGTKDDETLAPEKNEEWKFVYQRRLALERELANDALENQESADSDDDHAAGGDGEKMNADMDADSEDEYKSGSSSDEEMSEEDDDGTAGSED